MCMICVQMCSQAKASGIKLSEVHGVDKSINPDIKPERQVLKFQNPADKPKLGQGREGLRREINSPPGCKHSVQRNENPLDLDVYISSTHLLTFKILIALLIYPPLFLILIVSFYYPTEKLSLCFS